MKRKVNRLTVVLLSLVLMLGMIPGMRLTAYALSWYDRAPVEWHSDDELVVDQKFYRGLDIMQSITVTIREGVTMYVYCGLYIKEGHTLTVKGKGSLVVEGLMGYPGACNPDSAGNGGPGHPGIRGNVVFKDANVTVVGGPGGFGGIDTSGRGFTGGGGDGGFGIDGNVTVIGGNVAICGGERGTEYDTTPSKISHGGTGLNGNITVKRGKATLRGGVGGTGIALNGTVTSYYTAEESDDNQNWSFINNRGVLPIRLTSAPTAGSTPTASPIPSKAGPSWRPARTGSGIARWTMEQSSTIPPSG